jgi:hypothetical protein
VQLGLENKKKAIWAGSLGALALLLVVYEFAPMFSGSSAAASSSAAAEAPLAAHRTSAKNVKAAKKIRPETLDPTLQLQLLAATEETKYSGLGNNIFVSKAEEVVIPTPKGPAATDAPKVDPVYTPPAVAAAPPIPLKFFGFASKPGETKKIFLSQGEDVFVAAEGEIVDRRYKVVRISPNSVEMQDVVNSGPPQSIPLTQS